VRRRDVQVDDVLVALRDLGQYRRVVAERRLDVPRRQVAADLSLAVPFALRVDQKQHADGSPIAVEHVSEAREAVRHLSFGLSAQPVHPIVARTFGETPREEVSDGLEILRHYLAASDHGRAVRISKAHGCAGAVSPNPRGRTRAVRCASM
jgi:hypothetical protein